MVDIQQVTSDLYLIPLPIREGWTGSVLLVLGTTDIGLVDTGFEQTPTERIFPAVKQLGRHISDIQYVVNTHRDRDRRRGAATSPRPPRGHRGRNGPEADRPWPRGGGPPPR